MAGFSVDWLDLREAADLRARDAALLARAQHWLDQSSTDQSEHRQQPKIADLGCGTGSTLRAFAAGGIETSRYAWRLIDHDAQLLSVASERYAAGHSLETEVADLAQPEQLSFKDINLLTASAPFDLVSAEFIEALVASIASQPHPIAVYTALNYDGITRWTPAHKLDMAVLQAFNQDQRRDKGFGPALGPHASACLTQVLTAAGYTVLSASSPWLLRGNHGTAGDTQLMTELIHGIANAVQSSIEQAELQEWIDFRLANVHTGSCSVGHMDLLALPQRVSR
mgnify:FL=1